MESSESSLSSGRPHGKHSAPIETAQMSVLGRDGRDLIESCRTPPTSRAKMVAAMASTASSQQWRPPTPQHESGLSSTKNQLKASWWDGITTTASRWTKPKDDGMGTVSAVATSPSAAGDALEAAYASFDDESLASTLTPQPLDATTEEDRFAEPNKRHRRSNSRYGRNNKQQNVATMSLLHPQLEEGVELNQSQQDSSTMTKEDKLRQDCSFFYRDMDDVPKARQQSRKSQRRLSLSSATEESIQLDPTRAAFRARYDQLNAKHVINDDLELYFEDEYDNDNDVSRLFSPQFPRVADISKSSLVYNHDGRVLMRLPQDNVKLINDEHLEAGILSMECAPYSSEEPWRKQDLTYVLTVDDDLYRRVVQEMGDSYKTPCGLYYCCQEAESSGRVHIWVAIALLFCVLVFLLVNTIIWPLD